ncbi:MAG: hypothetical protein R6V62_02580 [Candidatus Fermentibacteraceae bacterium]
MSLFKQHRRDLPASDYSREKSRNALLFTLAVGVFAVLAGFMFRAQPESGQVLRHNLAPDFPQGYTWVNSPDHISLFQELKGHVVVVLFNSLSVLADLRDVNRMEEIALQFNESPVACVIVAAGIGSAQEASHWPMGCPMLLDPDSTVTRLFGVNAMPAVLIIDSNGAVAARYYESWEQIPLEGLIRDLLTQAYATRTIASERYTP